MEMELARKVRFEAAHRYYRDDWSREQNFAVFGACANDHGHGHTYALEVFFSGPVDPQTGMIINLKDVDDLLKILVKPLDQKNLNLLEPFKDKIPTTEVLADYLWQLLLKQPMLPNHARVTRLKLFESESLWVEITA
jgi:6-pyruvoyltetrahydropterin/6-carboxytetrahydropterin synthase